MPLVPACFLVTIRNISVIKESERLRSDMTSLMSHELRTPITSIKGFAELLMVDETISEENREFLEIIANESDRLAKMLTTFLSVSNLEQSDKQQFVKTPVKLDSVVSEVVEDLQETAKRKRIRLVEKSNTHLPPVARIVQIVFLPVEIIRQRQQSLMLGRAGRDRDGDRGRTRCRCRC